jgi:hypothetical protein
MPDFVWIRGGGIGPCACAVKMDPWTYAPAYAAIRNSEFAGILLAGVWGGLINHPGDLLLKWKNL